MTLPSPSRRRVLASAASAAGAAVAGCTAPTRRHKTPITRWTPASLLDARFRTVRYVDTETLRAASPPAEAESGEPLFGALARQAPWGFELSALDVASPDIAAADTDWWLHVGGGGRPPRATVAHGDFDPDRVADRLGDGRWRSVALDGSLQGFQFEGQQFVAVGDEYAFATTVREGETPAGPARAFRAAGDGDDRYAAAEDAYRALCGAVSGDAFARLSSVTEPFPETRLTAGLFEGLVTRGVGARRDGDWLRTTYAVVFADDSPPVDAVREWAEELTVFDRTRVDVDGRVVTVTAVAPVARVPLGVFTWRGARLETPAQ